MGNTFENKTVVITGASRGIGKAIGLRLAAEGANIVVAAKTVEPHPALEGTIYSAAEEIDAAGSGKVLAVQVDIRDESAITALVQKTIAAFGGIDILVNNASAIALTNTEQTPSKRYDLMQDINVRGSFLMSQVCIPHLKRADNPHILNLSPPIDLNPRWFGKHLAYTISKFGMSMVAMGLAEELKPFNIGVNTLWPKTVIATAAVQNLLGGDSLIRKSRRPEIVADAAFHIFQQPSAACTGNFFIDEEVLRSAGVASFDHYAVTPGAELAKDLFL